ncbi:MAG: D-cysteine desulfhydrase family protein [Gammaproteobacteria bacterium]|jgi:L-cysteate sulfo-lyase|nr:D-cysteine desulfhydrase family protein [Gammaproteobacteria bacterium]
MIKHLPWANLPHHPLGHWPTPLTPLDRLSEELNGPRVWLKRDDCSGLALGGNKTRKLEYLIGDALAQKADTVITYGAIQSNHARQTAAACAKAGLNCHLILTRTVNNTHPAYTTSGNVLLGRLTGAKQHIVAPEDAKFYGSKLVETLRSTGANVYVIPAGGSNTVGAMGYARCAEELHNQSNDMNLKLDFIMHASSSAGTQAGLMFGLQQLKRATTVVGINVYHQNPQKLVNQVKHLNEGLRQKFSPVPTAVTEVNVNHAYMGKAYGQATQSCIEAIKLAARLEGLIFDPVYSGKALAAMIDQINLGNLNHYSDVVLIHTGGSPALFVYDDQLV